jgi:hypothetical protein
LPDSSVTNHRNAIFGSVRAGIAIVVCLLFGSGSMRFGRLSDDSDRSAGHPTIAETKLPDIHHTLPAIAAAAEPQ